MKSEVSGKITPIFLGVFHFESLTIKLKIFESASGPDRILLQFQQP